MPYKVISEGCGHNPPANKKCFYVKDVKGKKFSKKPLTKPQARKQQIAIALSESRKTGELPNTYFM